MSNEKILNPKTNRMVSINSKLGRKITADQEMLVVVDEIINVPKVDEPKDIIEVIEVINVNDADVEKFENVAEVIDKKTYMKTYYQNNKDKIKERSKSRYALKKEINVFVEKINDSLLN